MNSFLTRSRSCRLFAEIIAQLMNAKSATLYSMAVVLSNSATTTLKRYLSSLRFCENEWKVKSVNIDMEIRFCSEMTSTLGRVGKNFREIFYLK